MSDLTPYVPSVLLGWQRREPGRAAWVEEGALAFLDVSGFTAMSERLGRLGREGGEVVADVIGSTFERLLTVAYEAGGSLLKFGGDALLLWFGGEVDGPAGAARRACFAAARMRATLRSMGAIPTPMGPVRVRVSAGVHAGTFHFFVVGAGGAAGKELLVTGPGATRTVEMESAASAGEILVSPETAPLVRRWTGPAKGPGVVLRMPPPMSDKAVPGVADPTGVDVNKLVSTAVRRHLEAGQDEPEHRHAAVGFVHFDGTDALIQRAGADAAAEQLSELVAAVQVACDDHGVALLNADVDKDGGKFLLSAGAPEASADEDERMLRTLRAILDADTRILLRAGAHRGLIFAGSIGPHYRRSYTLMGDVVNTAARVMAHARPGQLLATADVLDRSRTRFATRAMAPFSAKGKALPLVTFEVGGAQAGDDADRGGDGPAGGGAASALIGRVDEVWALNRLLEQAIEGAGGLVEITGQPGIGKSRLAHAVRAEGEGRGVGGVLLRASAYESATPYFPFRGVLRLLARMDPEAEGPDAAAQLRHGLSRLAPELAADEPVLSVALGLSPADDTSALASFDRAVFRSRLHRAVTSVLERSFHRPLLLVVEDAQWLDEASAELLRHLGRQARTRPWLLVIVRREGEGQSVLGSDGTRIDVGPLDPADAARLVRERAITPLLPAQVEHLVRQADGNPLFLEQLAASFDPDADVVPERLEELVAARIDRLPARGRLRLRQLAVLGPSFDLDAAAVVLGQPLLQPADVAGSLEDFVEVGPAGARFRQHVFQSVAYAGLSFKRRRQLHEQVALYLEDADRAGAEASSAAVLATHFDLAERFDRSWHYASAAGTSALLQHAYPEAASLYRKALRAAARVHPPDDEQLAAWRGLADALRMMGRHADAVAPYKKARDLAGGDLDVQARLAFLEADLRKRMGQRTGATRWVNRALSLLDGRPLDEAARVTQIRLLLMLGGIRHDQGRFPEAEQILRQALARAQAAGDRGGEAHASLWLAYTLTPVGGDDDSAYARRALELYREIDPGGPLEANAMNGLAGAYKRAGRWAAAADLYGRARALLQNIADPVAGAVLAYNQGSLLLDQGRGAEAVEALAESYATFTACKHAYTPVAGAMLARAYSLTGRAEAAESLFADAVPALEAGGLHTFAAEGLAHWAEHRVRQGDFAEADRMAAGLRGTADVTVDALAARVRGTAAAAQGDATAARAFFTEAVALARSANSEVDAAQAVLLAAAAGLGPVDPDGLLDSTTAELVLARHGVSGVSGVSGVAGQSDHSGQPDHPRRELCTRQSS
jgi:class 3 adenylate cyclase/tetratricopeptide (TPR) repeat protein